MAMLVSSGTKRRADVQAANMQQAVSANTPQTYQQTHRYVRKRAEMVWLTQIDGAGH